MFLTYVLSFVYLGIYWNNHHHLLHAADAINGRILWANLHLLFWLSLVPFATGWMGENHFAPLPTAVYGAVLLMAGVAYLILQNAIVAARDRLAAGGGRRQRHQGQAVGGALRRRHPAGLRATSGSPTRIYVVRGADRGSSPDRRVASRLEAHVEQVGDFAGGRRRHICDLAAAVHGAGQNALLMRHEWCASDNAAASLSGRRWHQSAFRAC